MAASSRHTGWRHDEANSRLDMYYRGTRVGHIDGCNGLTIASGGMAITGSANFNCCFSVCGNGVFNCCATFNCVANFSQIPNQVFQIRGDPQFLNVTGNCMLGCGSSACEPSCASKGVVWAWQGDACATAPCGSAFLMITDDGCV